MIPLHLTLSGFLSYHAPVELDFTCFDLACISGSNGAGKSSLLDAITWALFGQARKRDELIINAQSNSAEVRLDFSYEDNVYRVQRSLPRGKTTTLEFHIQQKGTDGAPLPGNPSPNTPCAKPRPASSRSCAWTMRLSSTPRSFCRAKPTSSPSNVPATASAS